MTVVAIPLLYLAGLAMLLGAARLLGGGKC